MTTFKLGDYVRFVDEELEGHITKILTDDLIEVTGEDGFAIPVSASKVTLVYGQFNKKDEDFDEKKAVNLVPSGRFVEEGIHLAITTDVRNETAFFYLVNETSYEVLLSFGTEKSNKVEGVYAGIIGPQRAEKIYSQKMNDIGNWPIFAFSILLHTPALHANKKALEESLKIRAFDLSNTKKTAPVLQEKAWLFTLDKEAEKLEIDKLKEQFYSHRPERKHK